MRGLIRRVLQGGRREAGGREAGGREAGGRIAVAGTDARALQAVRLLPGASLHRLLPGQPIGGLLAATPAAFIVLLAPGARLLDHALTRIADALLLHPDADLVYADEIGGGAAYRKPAWSWELALEQDLSGGFAVLRRSLLLPLAGEALPPAPHDLALLAAPGSVRHIPAVLSCRDDPAPAPTGAVPTGAVPTGAVPTGAVPTGAVLGRVIAAWPDGPSRPGLLPSRYTGRLRVRWQASPPPRVTVIVPTRNQAALLARCAAGVLHGTDYPDLELLIVDNGSDEPDALGLLHALQEDGRVRVLRRPGPFNYAALNNAAAAAASGPLLLLLNDDVEVLHPDWLGELAGHAMRPEVGAAGARLLFEDGSIQHAGIVGGVGAFDGGPGIAGHFGYRAPASDAGHGGQFIHTREVLAVTGACLAIRADVFGRAGGLDAVHLPVALNDLDLCLRLRGMGLKVVWTPFAELLHRQSASRGPDDVPGAAARFHGECRTVRDRWGAVLDADPYYNPAFSRFDHSFQPVPLVSGPAIG